MVKKNPFLDFQLDKFNLLYQRIIICDIELAQGNALCYKRWLGSVDRSINELLKLFSVFEHHCIEAAN